MLRVCLGFLVFRGGAAECSCDDMKGCAVGSSGWESLKAEVVIEENVEELDTVIVVVGAAVTVW